ncbi:hypothetical protein ACHAXA_006285 [Cyclostephanos tholiformis]|uniref:S1 motif domain-containing protein n=1 Tax=Cyclostephanos tholiformis TaxID=382380 RepID=A0ABD3SP20_9STRA
MAVLWRYMGLSSRPYMSKREVVPPDDVGDDDDAAGITFTHDLQVGDHVIRWKMLAYLYPIQVHGIVFSVGPDFVTIVDCGLSSYGNDDEVGNLEGEDRQHAKINVKTKRRRMQVVTLVDEKEIKKWTRIKYGEEVQLTVHSSNEGMHQSIGEDDVAYSSGRERAASYASDDEQMPHAGLDVDEVEKCVQAKIRTTPPKKSRSSSWFRPCGTPPKVNVESKPPARQAGDAGKQRLRLPEADPPKLVLARLRFLLEYGEEPFPPPGSDDGGAHEKSRRQNLLPPHHLLYANSECIAVFCKTGRWSTIQAAIFLHTSTVGNVKQTATVAMFLSAQTVTVPASGIWGWFGGTTTLPLFTAQPWLVPALVGGGMVYVGLPMLMLWKAKGTWSATERRLNDAFWSMCDPDVIVDMIRTRSGLCDRGS